MEKRVSLSPAELEALKLAEASLFIPGDRRDSGGCVIDNQRTNGKRASKDQHS